MARPPTLSISVGAGDTGLFPPLGSGQITPAQKLENSMRRVSRVMGSMHRDHLSESQIQSQALFKVPVQRVEVLSEAEANALADRQARRRSSLGALGGGQRRRSSVAGLAGMAADETPVMMRGLSRELLNPKSRWVNKFREVRERDRVERHAPEEEEEPPTPRRQPDPPELPAATPPTPWEPTRDRNVSCEHCLRSCAPGVRVACAFCNIVAHWRCLDAAAQADVRAQRAQGRPWACNECREDIEQHENWLEELRREQELKATMWKVALRLQALRRRQLARREFQLTLKRITMVQAAYRSIREVKNFAYRILEQMTPWRITVRRAWGLRSADSNGLSDPYVILTVVDATDPDRQLFRYTTTTVYETLDPVWEESFIVPGIEPDGQCVLTVVDEDDLRDDCLGQAHTRLNVVPHVGTHSVELEIDSLSIVPKEANRAAIRLGEMDAEGQGHIEISIQRLGLSSNLCGYLEEIKSSYSPVYKKWWCVLVGTTLYFYGYYGESTPKQVVQLKSVSNITRTAAQDDGIESMLVQSPRPALYRAVPFARQTLWFNKLTQALVAAGSAGSAGGGASATPVAKLRSAKAKLMVAGLLGGG